MKAHQTEPRSAQATPVEYKVVAIRECPLPEDLQLCDVPAKAAEYWQLHVKTDAHYDPERECLVVLMLNTRRRVKGHQFLTHGTIDTILVRIGDVYRAAIIAAAASIIVMHNHPSGETTPSEADIKVTRDLLRAGQLLKVELTDHVIVADSGKFTSLRELGHFYS